MKKYNDYFKIHFRVEIDKKISYHEMENITTMLLQIEIFFEQTKNCSGNTVNPTPIQLRKAFKKLLWSISIMLLVEIVWKMLLKDYCF